MGDRVDTRVNVGVAPRRGGARAHRDPLDPVAYLPFVDGMRAVAILAVVAFHVGIPGVRGGFVGVDVFFVISGFLIIGQIRAGLESGRFTFAEFYARRVLRILPPFLLVLFACLVIAPFVLTAPRDFEYFIVSSLFAPLFLANIYFNAKQGYFDIAADEKPLLHTWTLSVEEQFYLVTPILLFVLFRFGGRRLGRLALFVSLALLAASLAGSVGYSSLNGKNEAFYLAQWRAWEFIAGGLAGALAAGIPRKMPRLFGEAMAAAGLVLVLAAIGTIDARLSYPSWRAALPVAGAMLIIVAGAVRPSNLVSRLLSLRPIAGIGLISYSWYLWHWPVLSFLRIANFGERWFALDLAGGALSFVLAIATYRYLEAPVRAWRRRVDLPAWSKRIGFAGAGACAALVAVAGAAGEIEYSRVNALLEGRIAGREDLSCRLVSGAVPAECLSRIAGLMVGDSHADALFGTVARRYGDRALPIALAAEGGCSPADFMSRRSNRTSGAGCRRFGYLFGILTSSSATRRGFVIIYARWNNFRDSAVVQGPSPGPNLREGLRALLARLQSEGRRVLLIGPTPEFRFGGIACVLLAERYGAGRQKCDVPRAAVDQRREARVSVLREVAAEFPDTRFIDPIDLFCDAEVCRPYGGERIWFSDDNHLSPAGAGRVYDRFVADFTWVAGARAGEQVPAAR